MLDNLLEQLLLPIIFRIVVRMLDRFLGDDAFMARAWEVRALSKMAKTKEERQNAAKAIRDLLSG